MFIQFMYGFITLHQFFKRSVFALGLKKSEITRRRYWLLVRQFTLEDPTTTEGSPTKLIDALKFLNVIYLCPKIWDEVKKK